MNKKDKEFANDACLSMASFRKYYSKEKIMAFAEDLYRMASDDGAKDPMTSIAPWLDKHKLYRSTVYEWRREHPEFEQIYKDAMNVIGYRLQEKSLQGVYDPNFVKLILPMYSEDFKECQRTIKKFENDLRKEAAAANKAESIVIYSQGAQPSNNPNELSIILPELKAEDNGNECSA